ncbi:MULTISPECIES: ArnT family glycosyltransferase [unclassified Tolypothrix]|uniref:ArnT family glycosyltransferase n=1 Tax=unclassified Tolypothrix TaxID=2649714 RepID=UPI0005EAA625|nr:MULTISPECIES: glycosyltransferase family 39 protein [unclassified Tolypothrix]BAY92183.1 family 39 glycosyl transferase [Microchaete diplosiphon NIES-3275]EKE98553.1 dolichyl-phosphate-mannose-protein mannosyltransferase [Tolypothrix sp. PCC 7601]MBE9085253.1 glycosyltransferase family 39 protein [Tolypothrix sp. LEGE 11397]UYD26160.1 glycosyltransferase family 39 protein [Tolypothrix sp. PCC 7712]UYD31602.1 glycosyltransferase family 39 protein [Tolypothrix sp. PCC 7601]
MNMKLSLPHTVGQWCKNILTRPALAVTVSVLWLIVIGWIAYGWNLGNIGLVDETEPLFAEASRQMFITGDWITPFFNAQTRFDKPALIYWCQAIAYGILGVNEWAARIPSALAAMGTVALAFYTVHWSLARKDELEQVSRPVRRYLTAGLAATVMALTPEMIAWGRIGVSDMLLTGCIASALLCFFLGYAQNSQFPKNKWYWACYVLVAGAILTKGPVGIVLPALIIGAFVIYQGNLVEVWRQMRPLVGLLIILGLSVPWYALVIWRNGWNYINSFFGYHNIERFTEVVNGHSAPWYFYFLVVLLGFAPYSVYLPAAMIRLKFWQRSHWRSQERSQQLGLFACIWFLAVFGFFTIAVTKLPSYVLPLMPAAAILVALLWSDLIPEPETDNHKSVIAAKSFVWSSWINVIFLSAVAAALFHLAQLVGYDPAAPELYQSIQQMGLPAIGGMIWLLVAIIIAAFTLTRRWQWIITANLLGFVIFFTVVLMPTLFVMDQQRQQPLRELATIAAQVEQPKEELIMLGFKKPSVVFYSHKTVNYISSAPEVVDYIHKQNAQPAKLNSLLLLAEKDRFLAMDLEPEEYKHIASKGAYYLVRVPVKKIKKQKLDISYSVPNNTIQKQHF